MTRLLRLIATFGIVAILASGCAVNRATSVVDPSTDLSKLKTMYVKKYAEDSRNVNELIVSKLRSKGLNVTTGSEERPKNVDAVVTYVDRWFWDITMYMLELTVVIRDADSGYALAQGNSLHTSLTRLSPEEMVNEVINNIYGGTKK
ncbi:MAG: hypothetical protein C4516_00745 [Oxalobacter sp.]|jgi:hypothetical protein|nr:MAG: hypothetical protein C4516_00745 [Oxalobacter sp.]